ncbi:hypothetical protein L500_3260 [Bordetella holmesii CDC-H643-BH]|uniref:Uncharacterized protein n=1 Tax=Bordetella holmesii CDC-H585-BH TaxID=1331206 RepID=A0A158M643_9BORD|nr:hypothetical protein L496_2984 [Bordetella holmesii CDC-H572-BH]KAK81886.1 hypothetical protein L573_3066 [Bordetella holmesii H620]KAK85514.1 hypothetical protein L503_3019 [Bordetella holmesii CDC-H809-BH]KAK90841.1 hypothetical protein L497_3015 [Bordetella holmesii CDC-H585-BH]KCV02023.1 hypothetical protein L498_3107 [Bordetella holmesii CDC-H629-BH]KCV05113.1 hypothetical protein L501_3009 [Bordetella holmesii CDC-H719-BH]KCV09727.1 hypothetical protein L502_2989 [Bordetella holmesii
MTGCRVLRRHPDQAGSAAFFLPVFFWFIEEYRGMQTGS